MSDTYAVAIDALTSLPAAITAMRRSRGVSLRAVAREAGVSFSTVTRMEHGEDATIGSAVAMMRWLIAPAPIAADVAIDLSDDDTAEPGAIVWTCDQCGKRGRWEPGWTWFGSHRQMDLTGKPEAVMCSPACRTEHATAKGVDPEVSA